LGKHPAPHNRRLVPSFSRFGITLFAFKVQHRFMACYMSRLMSTALRSVSILAAACALVLAAGCSVYRPDIQQGNLITSEQVAQLKEGMTRLQVQALLGSPLLRSDLHANRWDYGFAMRKRGEVTEMRRFTLFFDGDKLIKWEGDPQPTATEALKISALPAAAGA
jgi:outer membrane protein assembly factor BamE